MRTKFRAPALTLVLVVALTAAGCTPDTPRVERTPTPSATPLFATDEEALAAAEKAYAEYLAVTDEIFEDSGRNPERLLSVATQQVLDAQMQGYSSASAQGWTSVGKTKLDTVFLQQYLPTQDRATVSIYGCVDLSDVDVFDASGVSVVSPTRPDRSPFEVTLDRSEGDDRPLIVSGESPWTGTNFCL